MSNIKSITEAFSMQPISHTVKRGEYYKGKDTNGSKSRRINQIKIEKRIIDNEEISYAVGYNEFGEILFSYLLKSVNIDYFTEYELKNLGKEEELPI